MRRDGNCFLEQQTILGELTCKHLKERGGEREAKRRLEGKREREGRGGGKRAREGGGKREREGRGKEREGGEGKERVKPS